MRSKLWVAAAAGLGLVGLGSSASAQIIATSIPREAGPAGKGGAAEKKYAFHLFGSPFAKWKYGEVYLGGGIAATVQTTPNSTFMLAGEGAFRLTDDFSLTAGGWYNKVGSSDYDMSGVVPSLNNAAFTAIIEGDLSLYEGHVGLFYRDYGIQGGIVKTTGRIGPNGHFLTIQNRPNTNTFVESNDDANTTDYDLFLVYKRTGGKQYPWGVSVGAGTYWKQGIPAGGSPLRLPDDTTVFTAFGTLNVQLYKGLGVDVSYWYVGKTELTGLFPGQTSPDAQSRFTVGVGYTFSR